MSNVCEVKSELWFIFQYIIALIFMLKTEILLYTEFTELIYSKIAYCSSVGK